MVTNLVLHYNIVKKLGHTELTEKFKKYIRLIVSKKQEIIHMVTRSEIRVNRTLREIEIKKIISTIDIILI